MWKPDWVAIRKLDWVALGGIALRNAVPVAGMIVSGFRAGEIVLLYYVDTLASIATVFALIMMYVKGMGVDPEKPLGAVNIVFSTAFITAIFAVVCAIPLVVAAATDGIDWSSEQLRVALLVQLLFASTGFLTMSREMRVAPDRDARLKARFAYVFVRWIAVFAVCTTIPWAPLLVLTYVVASVWLEIKPIPPDIPEEAPSAPNLPSPARRRNRRNRRT